jgi:hypothetical protein
MWDYRFRARRLQPQSRPTRRAPRINEPPNTPDTTAQRHNGLFTTEDADDTEHNNSRFQSGCFGAFGVFGG